MGQSQSDSMGSATRRNFLKLAGTMATGAVVSNHTTEIASALGQATDGSKEVVWLQGQCCSGCTISMLQGEYPSLEGTLSEFRLDVTFHPTLMTEWGDGAIESMSEDPDILIVEGSIPTQMVEAATVGLDDEGNPKPVVDWVRQLAPNAEYVIAVGNCASFGGWPAAENKKQPNGGPKNVTGAKGLQYEGNGRDGVLGPDFTAGSGLPVVNIGGCPPQPDYILLTLATILNGHTPELDDKNRPLAFYEPNVHDQCSLRGEFDRGEFADHPGDDGCLYKVGCAGPYTYCDDSKRLWNGGTSVCRDVGAPCIGCMEPAFWDRFTPFYDPIEEQSVFAVDAETAGMIAVAGTVAGVGAHAVRKAMGYGSPEEAAEELTSDDSPEEEKATDGGEE